MLTPPFDPSNAENLICVSEDISAAVDRRLHQLHAYWQSRSGTRPMPSRSDIDPVDLPALLPHLFLVNVLDDPRDFRFRLAGTHFREFTGIEVTGRRIDEVFPPEFCAEVHYHWNRCVDCRIMAVGSGKLWLPEKSHVHWEGVVLPLSPDGSVVNMFLGGVIFTFGSSG